MPEYIELEDVELKHQTAKAGLFVLDDGEQIWIPWSQVEDNGEDMATGYTGSIFVTEWFAGKEGLV